MVQNAVNSFLETSEKVEVVKNTRSGGFDYDLYYPKLILQEDTPSHISFLTDFIRGVKFKVHWNDEKRGFDLCNDHYKLPCKSCEESKKAQSKADKAAGKKRSYPSEMRLMFTYCYDKVGVTKESTSGVEYQEEPVCIAEIRKGEGGVNFKTLQEANGEHPDFMDLYDFYEIVEENGVEVYRLKKESLKNNYLMYEDNGEAKIWQLRKTKSGEGKNAKTTYNEPKYITHNKARQNFGKDTKFTVPKEVREYFDNKSAAELLPFFLVNFSNVQWDLLGMEPPKEGDKLVLSGATKKVDASKEL